MTPPETSRASYLGGYWFIFSDEARQIAAWGSSLTGLERIYVDGVQVSERRKLATESAHGFSVGERRYRVSFEAERSAVRCRLERDGVQAGILQIRWLPRRQLAMWQVLVLAIALTGGAAWVAETLDVSYWPLGAAAVILAVGVYCYAVINSEFIVEPD